MNSINYFNRFYILINNDKILRHNVRIFRRLLYYLQTSHDLFLCYKFRNVYLTERFKKQTRWPEELQPSAAS